MVLYRTDAKLLCRMKRLQGSLDGYVLLTDVDLRYCPGCSSADANKACESSQRIYAPKLSKTELVASLNRMVGLGLLKRPAYASIYQVTYDGWNARQIRVRELFRAVVTHVLFPSLVALITTLLTLSLKSCSDHRPEVYSEDSAANPAYYDDADSGDFPDHG